MRLFALLLCGWNLVTALAAEDPFRASIRPVLEEFCFKCHSFPRPKAGVNFSSFTNTPSLYHDIRLWEKVADQLRNREMPPEGKPQPGNEQRDRLVEFIDKALKDLDEGNVPKDPGRVTIHRLSRTEYNCTVRDLLGVTNNPADKFPADGGGGGGFDNNADTLFIPPILMERYLEAAKEILENTSPEKIFFAKPGLLTAERAAARKILSHYAMRAYRRPLEKGELDGLAALFEKARAAGQEYQAAVKTSLSAILISPNFLFRVEKTAKGDAPWRINDYELASRLSYFLWSSMPDEGLFSLAAQNRLHEPETLDREVRRMLKDPKSRVFSDNFAGQWWRVRELRTAAQPDRRKFNEYNPELRESMYAEAVEFFDHIMREDRPLLEIISADYTFVNEDLATHYGLSGIKGKQMQKVTFPDGKRGGVLGMGGVLTITSYPLRTSPVLRGKWVLEEMLGTPPPPPPPLVKSLSQDDAPRAGMTFRQRLEQHREKVECASCHKRMDPLGFGLENFDAIGRWRTDIGGEAVDSSGVLPTGEKFSGPAELKKILLGHRDDFVRNLTEKMLAYALGRGLEYYDVPTVKSIMRTLVKQDFRSSVLVSEVVKSYPFQFRRNEPVQMTSK